MQINSFDLNLLKALDALLTEKNVTRAAKRINLSQPAMSGALRRLREQFNDQLLIRVGMEMRLTPLAASLAVSVHELFHNIQSTLDIRPTFDPAATHRSFTIAMTDYASMVLLPAVLKRVTVEAPYITCHVQSVTEATYGGMIAGDIDFCVGPSDWMTRHTAQAAGHLKSEPLFSDDFVCVVDRDQSDIGDKITLEQYKERPHNLVRFGHQLDSIVETSWGAAGLELHVAATAPNFSTLILMLPQTRLIATVQRRLAKVLTPSMPLKVLECPVPMPLVDEALAWHMRSDSDPAHGYMRAILFDTANAVTNLA